MTKHSKCDLLQYLVGGGEHGIMVYKCNIVSMIYYNIYWEGRHGLMVYKCTSHSSSIDSIYIVCSPEVTLFRIFDFGSSFMDHVLVYSSSTEMDCQHIYRGSYFYVG